MEICAKIAAKIWLIYLKIVNLQTVSVSKENYEYSLLIIKGCNGSAWR